MHRESREKREGHSKSGRESSQEVEENMKMAIQGKRHLSQEMSHLRERSTEEIYSIVPRLVPDGTCKVVDME
jgi:hypothetical protein